MSGALRLAGPADLTSVEAIVRRAYTPFIERIGRKPGPMLDDYAALIADRRVHLAERDGRPTAILVLLPETDAMLLDNMAVDPDFQGRGIGRVLMEFAEDAARAAGYTQIRLYTNVAMVENIEIYTRRGYTETHRVEEKGLHRVYMRKGLA